MKASSFGTTFLSNGAWSFLNQLARVASLAFITIALSRHFGPQHFGSFAFGLAFVRIFGVAAAFGLDRVIVRHLVERPEQRSTTIRQAFRLKLALAFSSYVLMLIVCAVGISDRITLAIAALAGSGLLFQAFDVFDFAFQAEHRFRAIFIGRALPILVSAALKITALIANASLLTFAALETVEAALVGAALFFAYRKCSRSSRQQPDANMSIKQSRLLAEGFPLLLASLAVMIYMRSDVVMLGKMVGYGAAGIYAAASQISEGCALLPLALMPALFPVLVRWRRLGPDFYKRQFERLFLFAVIGGLAFSLTLTFAAPALVTLLFGPNYLPAANVLVVHGWTILFIFIGITQSGYDVTEGLTWFATFRTFVGALLNIGLNLILIPRHGVVGSAVATLVAQIFSSVLLNALHPRTRPILRMQLMSILLWPAFRAVYRNDRGQPLANWQGIGNRVKLADG